MTSKFLTELSLKDSDSQFEKIEIVLFPPSKLEITTPDLLTAKNIENLFYSFYNKLNYLFDYIDYQIKVSNLVISENIIREYFFLIFATPFLWKDKNDLAFFCQQKELWEKFTFRRNIVYLPVSEQNLDHWKAKIITLKEILEKLGLVGIHFASQKKNLIKNSVANSSPEKEKKKENKTSEVPAKTNNNKQSRVRRLTFPREWKKRKLFELGIHTKFSTLDGISSPADYVKNAKEKNYAALAITDHYNVQSFPEFSKHVEPDLKIVYGCELEMLEDKLPPYIFNYPDKKVLEAEISNLTYCVFDLETTGFFSSYNEIIEIGYVIYQNGKIIKEKGYLVCPENEFSPELFSVWYDNIDPEELKKSPKIKEILPLLRSEWKNCILVAHNARKFDYGFLNKVWKENLGEELPYPVLDTLPLSWILFPDRKYYSLEKLIQVPGKGKIIQTHRALDDSQLLSELLEKIIKTLKEKKITNWGEIENLDKNNFFPNRGYRVKVLATSQEGLHNLYRLVTLSHTKRLFRNPCVFRSDLVKYRSGLLLGAAGGREGEIFSLFSSFNSREKRKERILFYDYLEVNSPESLRYLWINKGMKENDLKKMIAEIIETAEETKIPAIASHNVHYCQNKEKKLKEIIVANEGMSGRRHYLYKELIEGEKDKKDRFSDLPPQHLLTLEEMLKNWSFLNDKDLIEKIIFTHPCEIVKKIGEVRVQQPPLNYSATESIEKEERELVNAYTQKAKEMFGDNLPQFVCQRIEKEWKIIRGNYVFIYWLSYKVVQKTHADGFLIGSRGSIGSSFIAYLCGITDLNPLPFYKFCQVCHYAEPYQTSERTYCCYDYREKEECPNCSALLNIEGHNLPFETFFGWKGEKTPDIDLNFSGEYQKVAHNYVRKLLGEDSVYRIGTINTLSQQTAEIFWREHLKLRQKLDPGFSEKKWYKEWAKEEKVKELQKQLTQLRQEKFQLESTLKKTL